MMGALFIIHYQTPNSLGIYRLCIKETNFSYRVILMSTLKKVNYKIYYDISDIV